MESFIFSDDEYAEPFQAEAFSDSLENDFSQLAEPSQYGTEEKSEPVLGSVDTSSAAG
jgi:hypothetical protein